METVDIHNTALSLATELETTTGDSWIVAPGPRGHNAGDGLSRWTSIVRGDGLELTIRTTIGKPQIRISQPPRNEKWVDSDGENVDPRDYLPDGEREAFPSIGVAASQSIAVIAQDVCTRVLPVAARLHFRALDKVAAAN